MKCNECFDINMILILNANKNVMRNYLHDTCENISTRQIIVVFQKIDDENKRKNFFF